MDDPIPDFLNKRIHALYIHDANERLLRVNETDSQQIVPRFYVLRTATALLWRLRYDVLDNIAIEIEHLVRTEPSVAELDQPLVHDEQYLALLGQEQIPTKSYAGPAYYLPKLEASGKTITITAENKALLAANFQYAIDSFDEISPIVVTLVDEVAVAICFCSRKTPYVVEAGVYTEEGYRKQGYAADVVRDWSSAVYETGRIPFYSTAHDNKASQAIAKKLGAVRYGTDFSFA